MSSSSSSLEKEIDEYQDIYSGSEGNYESSENSTTSSNSSNEHYSSRVLGIPLEEFQELQHRMASGSEVSSSKQPSSPPQDKEEEEEEILFIVMPLK